MAVSPALVARLFGNGTKVGRRETSPKGSCRVECCRGAIPHPKVLHQHVVAIRRFDLAAAGSRSTSRRLRPLARRPGRRAVGRLLARR
jgi:hypothetical protein